MPATGRGQTSLLSSFLATDNPGLCKAPTQLIIGAVVASQATRTCRELEKGTCDDHHGVSKISEGGKNSAHKPYQTILVKVRSYSITNRQLVKQAQKMVYARRADASWNRKKSRNKWSKIVSANCEKESEKSPAKGLKSSKFLKSFKTPDCSNCGLDRNKRQLSDPHLLIS